MRYRASDVARVKSNERKRKMRARQHVERYSSEAGDMRLLTTK